ncbi:hypothetical protein PGB34_18490 [Xenophilus arseniciresistens]|uniref:Uncharacterized protein n=1 Tax=Xenophilus arseniciresistens TaxID=1283306 RepID=A0AAE3NCM6_9BURK|nr:hypothetical protein [Xenophilus arseniciresistens]MDA7418361.1 hypothetical protein [Xenophilus arseniciresistens]
MERVILYVDDATHALGQLEQLRASGLRPTHWVLAACAPRMTSRISKWVSHSARENWRVKWFARLQETLAPALQADGAEFTAVLAQGPLLVLTQQLLLAHGAARVIDLRRPKVGAVLEPVQSGSAEAAPRAPGRNNGALSGGALGVGALMVLAQTLAE